METLGALNDRQREAALINEGPLLIVAGAGAGKTKTITHRIAHLIETGIPARSILAVTFTNKAAGEMRDRIRALLPDGHGMPFVSTFHALGVRLLREFHAEAGLPRGFTIWDRDDSLRAVKAAAEKLDIQTYPPRGLLAAISREKGDGRTCSQYAELASSPRQRAVANVWRLYDERLVTEDALDFDDLLLRTLTLLADNEEVRSRLQNRWTHITIDEYQDTNRSQYEIARLLAGEAKNLCVVGDIDQNIYSWRGAEIEHLLNFERAFPGTHVVTLEQNYRSTRTILTAANAIIEKNQKRLPKNLFTENETGEPITVYGGMNDMDEAWFIGQTIAGLIESGTKTSETAILYRENFQSRALEEAMLAFSIPYRVLGVRFFERKEVKDVLAYLRASMNPKSRIDLARVAAVPSRGIGKQTLEKLLTSRTEELAPAARTKVESFLDILRKIKHAIDTLPASEAVRFAIEASGMAGIYKDAGKGTEGEERLGNMHELANFATRYDFDEPPTGIEKLIEEAALQSDQDELSHDHGEPRVSLMTVHASKGLEFDAVFVTGLEQGLFPSLRVSEDRDEEEERRLFYVAVTRARKRLFLTHARERMKYGSRELAVPSEFFDDIDERLTAPVVRKRGLLDDEDIIR